MDVKHHVYLLTGGREGRAVVTAERMHGNVIGARCRQRDRHGNCSVVSGYKL